mmetsp:Transcript_43094/g.125407  ORF Transcript_43094/g.125407 Transcript_43094/m.125407 type:complete len:922 (-) Transcript_43094:472-3237(-)
MSCKVVPEDAVLRLSAEQRPDLRHAAAEDAHLGSGPAPTTAKLAQPQEGGNLTVPTGGALAAAGHDENWPTETKSKQQQVKIKKILKPLLYSKMFMALQVTALSFALFGGGVWTICDIKDSPGNAILDTLMITVTVLFIVEIIVTCLVEHREYPWSSFFWMDILGTCSMVFEISFLLGSAGKLSDSDDGNVDGALLRAVRATRVAARAGRLTKILKCISVFNIHRHRGANAATTAEAFRDLDSGEPVHAKILSSKLVRTLSTKVSLLTLVLVLIVPLFQIGQYPEEDLSMRAWSQRIEEEYGRAYEALRSTGANQTDIFRRSLESLKNFYGDAYYHPFLVAGFPSVITMDDGRVAQILDLPMPLANVPVRSSSIVRKVVPTCIVQRDACKGGDQKQVMVCFDFTQPYQVAAVMDIFMIFFIIAVMAAASANFTNTLENMVVRPIEHILGMLKSKASRVLRNFGLHDDDEGDDDDDPGRKSETELLENIFSKLARLATLAPGGNVATEAEFMALDDAGKGVMVDMMHVEVVPSTRETTKKVTTAGMGEGPLRLGPAADGIDSLNRDMLESWSCDLLSMDVDGLRKVALYVFFHSQWRDFLGSCYTTLESFTRFWDAVRANYNDMPYHNFIHATDTCHTTYRLMCSSGVSGCFTDIEKYSLLVAAMGHDLGHQGLTNQFLVETKHELALRWHDKSPLENMHCANLFEICNQPGNNVFKNADTAESKQARKVCISAILHTDLVHHVDMVKNVNRIYEMFSDICEAHAAASCDLNVRTSYEDMFRKDSMMWLEMFLHLADISNPLKPFKICEAWAHRIIEEFFNQGDEEKRLGLPVGMLNDRDKINKPGSQHGFISFLVAPLVTGVVQVLPPLHSLGTQLVSNLSMWLRLWVEDARPSQEDIHKRDGEIKRLQDITDKQKARIVS